MAGTAQDAYRQMLREHVAPALRALGFKRGPSLGAFRYETATHAAEVRFRKSRSSTRQEVDFWVDLHASWIKTEWVYWEWTLEALAPEPLSRWEVTATAPVEPVASEVLGVFRSYGWPAIQAALDNPGYPRDPAVHWPRTFPKRPGDGSPTRQRPTGRPRRSWNRSWPGPGPTPAPSRLCSPSSKPIPTRPYAKASRGTCSAGPTRNAAARRCEPQPPRMKTSKSGGSPGTP
jgi:hypothetical protein